MAFLAGTAVAVGLIGGVVGAAVERHDGGEPAVADGAVENRSDGSARVIRFRPRDGWNTGSLLDAGRADLPIAWTTSVPLASDARDDIPDHAVEALPAGGILVEAFGPRPASGRPDFPRLGLPLELADARCPADGYEGQPAPPFVFCYLDRLLGEDVLNVTVWINRGAEPWPSPGLIAEADEALARLEIPAAG